MTVCSKDKTNIEQIVNIREGFENLEAVLKDNSNLSNLTSFCSKENFWYKTKEMLEENNDKHFICVRLDIDNFRVINLLYGRGIGDELLKELSLKLKRFNNRYLSTCFRIEADIFFGCYEISVSIEKFVKTLLEDIKITLRHNSDSYPIKFSIGIYELEDYNVDFEEIYSKCTLAAKECKRHCDLLYKVYTEEQLEEEIYKIALVNGMYTGIKNKQFEVYLQPKISLQNGEVIGAEALVRWNHPGIGFISPAKFIPIFEEKGIIKHLDFYIYEEVSAFIRNQIDAGKQCVPISVNVSRVDLCDQNIVSYLQSLLTKYQLPVEYLHLEITESAYIEEMTSIVDKVKELKSIGFVIELDDFGEAYSSINTMRELPIDILKLDISLIKNIATDEKSLYLVRSILDFAEKFRIKVVAEGIERQEQLSLLKELRCHMGQGYIFSPPIPLDEFQRKLKCK